MRLTRTLIGAGLSTALLLAGPAVATATAATARPRANTTTADPQDTANDCDKGPWPAGAQGQPTTLEAGAAAGAWVWHDDNGWHLRVTHTGDDEVTFTGVVRADTTISDKRANDERNDVLKDGRNDRSFAFRFKNYGHLDGVDFRTDCATKLHFRLAENGHKLATSAIQIGHGNHHPRKNPFVIRRAHAPRPTTTTTAGNT